MNINLTYGVAGSQYELLVSEPGGAVLLDTLAVGNVPVIAALRTNDTLVDVTTILPQSPGYFDITCYKSINASSISTPSQYDYTIVDGLKTPATTPATIYYMNIPPGILSSTLAPQFLFSNFPWNDFTGASTVPVNEAIRISRSVGNASWEALSLVEQGAWLRAGAYVIGSNALGFVGVWLGATLARLYSTSTSA